MIFLVIDFTSFADALESEVVRRCLARRMAVNRRFGYRRKFGRIATALLWPLLVVVFLICPLRLLFSALRIE